MYIHVILLWGLLEDSPLAAVLGALAARGDAYFLVDQIDVLDSGLEIELDARCRLSGKLEVAGSVLDLASVGAAYVRPYDSRRLLAVRSRGPQSEEWAHATGFEDLLWTWAECSPALVVNRPGAMASNSSKPYQSGIIARFGFRVPETLVTTDEEAAFEFWERHRDVVYKSVSGVRSIVSRLTAAHLPRLPDIKWCPTQFQEYVTGVDHRAHVVGDRVFACQVRSEADDYRYAGRLGASTEVVPWELPVDCRQRCIALTRALGLVASGLDLRLTPDGEWVCFEVNPSPAFTYYDQEPDRPIARALAELLAQASVEAVRPAADFFSGTADGREAAFR